MECVDNHGRIIYLSTMKNKDAKPPRPSLFNLRQLSLVSWLLSAPEGARRFMVDTGKVLKFYETGAPREEDGLLPVAAFNAEDRADVATEVRADFGGSFKFDMSDLMMTDLVRAYPRRYPNMAADAVSFEDKVADIYIPGKWNLESVYYEIAGDWTGEWYLEKGKARREKLLSAVKEKDAALLRRAVFGRTVQIQPSIPEELAKLLPEHYRFELPGQTVVRPCMVATIVSETDKRFKVRDEQPINGNSTHWMGLEIKHEKYVEREYLLLDNATDADVAALAAFDEEYIREVEEIGRKTCEEIVPIIARMAERLAQKKGQQKDMLADLIASLKKDGG